MDAWGTANVTAACESTSIARPRRVRWRKSASAGHPDIGRSVAAPVSRAEAASTRRRRRPGPGCASTASSPGQPSGSRSHRSTAGLAARRRRAGRVALGPGLAVDAASSAVSITAASTVPHSCFAMDAGLRHELDPRSGSPPSPSGANKKVDPPNRPKWIHSRPPSKL